MVAPIYDLDGAVQRFRAAIRPAMLGNIGRIEPYIAARASDEIYLWLHKVVNDAIRSSGIRSQTGELAKQLHAGVRVTGRSSLRTMTGRIWVQPWVFAHEFGAHITPKNAEHLAIPFGYGVHPDGRPKFRSPTSWSRYGSFVKKHSDGRKFIVYRSGGTLKYLYVLVDSVDIPARLGLTRMANAELGTLLATFTEIFIEEMAIHGVDIDVYPGAVL